MQQQINNGSVNAAWGGILLSIAGINLNNMLQTIILAAVGTVVSFCTAALLKKFAGKRR
jgi:hypothetical protein